MLDFYNALGAAVRGLLDEADTMAKVNHPLRDLVSRFELPTTPSGVEIRPVLSAATAARIIAGLHAWPYGLRFAGRDVVRDEPTGALVCFAEPEEAVLFEDAQLCPRPAPTLAASDPVPIVPPLRAFAAPCRNSRTPRSRGTSVCDGLALSRVAVA
jgi:hypothetical protein